MAERVEPPEPVLDVEIGMRLGGDPERALGQRASIGGPGQRHEPAPWIHDGPKLSGSPVTAPGGTGQGKEPGEEPRLEERAGRHEIAEDAHQARQMGGPARQEPRGDDREGPARDDPLEDEGHPGLRRELGRAPGVGGCRARPRRRRPPSRLAPPTSAATSAERRAA